jgi:hypothetical protein
MCSVLLGTIFNGVYSVRREDNLTPEQAKKRKACYDNDSTVDFCVILD